jgi:hypothetical protein
MLADPAPPGRVRRFGLETPEVVRLVLRPDLPAAVQETVHLAAGALRDGRLRLPG